MTSQWPDNCDAITWITLSNSLDIDFIHGDIHGRSCKSVLCFCSICNLWFATGNYHIVMLDDFWSRLPFLYSVCLRSFLFIVIFALKYPAIAISFASALLVIWLSRAVHISFTLAMLSFPGARRRLELLGFLVSIQFGFNWVLRFSGSSLVLSSVGLCSIFFKRMWFLRHFFVIWSWLVDLSVSFYWYSKMSVNIYQANGLIDHMISTRNGNINKAKHNENCTRFIRHIALFRYRHDRPLICRREVVRS